MFHQFCGLSGKNPTEPRVAFVQESDLHHFQQHIPSIESKDNAGMEVTYETPFEMVNDGSSFTTTPYGPISVENYVDQQVHGPAYLPNSMDSSQLNEHVQFHTPVQGKPQEGSASDTQPNPNSNENHSLSVNSQKVSGKGENPERVLTLANTSRPFPTSVEQHEKLTALSFSPRMRTNDRIPNRGQRLLQEKNLSIFQLSPIVPGIDNRLNHGQRNFQERGLRVSPYGPNLQPSLTTQPMHQSPMQNQEKNRLMPGTTQFPSSGNDAFNFESLDAEYGAIPWTPDFERKLQLNKILITPVVTMKGSAYDATRWYEKDIDTERNFHSSCTDFLKIATFAKAQETAKKLKEFLCSDLIEPRYVPSEHIFMNRRLNHFHVYWNVMHQLPYYVKKWNKKTKAQLIWFYEVGVAETLPCPFCQKHFSNWLKQMPVSDAVGSRMELNQWLFKLHDDVNRRSHKPNFQWKDYERRWAPNGKRNNIGKSDLQLNDESKQDNMDNSLSFGVPSQQVVNLQETDFMAQRDVNTAPNIYDSYPVYPAVNQIPPMGYPSPFPRMQY